MKDSAAVEFLDGMTEIMYEKMSFLQDSMILCLLLYFIQI